MVIMSACLCGVNCKYSGGNNLNQKCVELFQEGKAILVCPEQLGGLKTPRGPAEIVGDNVVTKKGIDVTKEFLMGANEVLKIAKLANSKKAILKEGSPSCGCNFIYDGSFLGRKVAGEGLTTHLLRQNGIKVISEQEL